MIEKLNKLEEHRGWALFVIILLALLFTLSITLIRSMKGMGEFLGEDAYYQVRLSKEAAGKALYDPLLYSPTILQFNPLSYLMSGALALGIRRAQTIIPAALGIGSLIVYYLLLSSVLGEERKKLLACAIVAISPAFLYIFGSPHAEALSVFLTLLGLYMAGLKRWFFSVLSVLFLVSTALFGVFNIMLVLALLIVWLAARIKPRQSALPAGLALLALFSFYLSMQLTRFHMQDFIKAVVSDFGSVGFGSFTLILSAIGTFVLWRKKQELIPLYVLLVLVLMSLFFSSTGLIYLAFILGIYASYSFFVFLEMKWDIQMLRDLTVLTLACGLLFSTISFLNQSVNAMPDNHIVESLQWLGINEEEGIVLSHPVKGHWIEFYASMPVLLDSAALLSANQEIQNDTNTLFHSRNIGSTQELLRKYRIRYIWIDSEMLKGQVWRKPDEGLLFLFRNNETFKKLYTNQDVQIWGVTLE